MFISVLGTINAFITYATLLFIIEMWFKLAPTGYEVSLRCFQQDNLWSIQITNNMEPRRVGSAQVA